MKRPLTKIKRVSLSLLLLVVLGVVFSGILHPEGIICSEPSESTYPDFDVEFGTYKLERNLPDKFRNDTFDFRCVWTDNYKASDIPDLGHGSYIHFIVGHFNSKNRENPATGAWNPQIDVYYGFMVHLYLIYLYFGVIGFLFFWWLRLLSRSRNQS